MLWVETPSNPLLRITDIRAAVRGSRKRAAHCWWSTTPSCLPAGSSRSARRGSRRALDHQVPQRPQRRRRRRGDRAHPELHEQLCWWANCLGVTGAPFDSYLTLRGLRTLQARLAVHQQQCARAGDVAAVEPGRGARVLSRALPTHPGHEHRDARSNPAYGAIVSFELEGRASMPCQGLLCGLKCFSLAESLGGVESLIAHPASMTHAAMDAEARRAPGITDGLLRLSVGIEAAAGLARGRRGGPGARGATRRERLKRREPARAAC